mgnify:CR=1 FL=1
MSFPGELAQSPQRLNQCVVLFFFYFLFLGGIFLFYMHVTLHSLLCVCLAKTTLYCSSSQLSTFHPAETTRLGHQVTKTQSVNSSTGGRGDACVADFGTGQELSSQKETYEVGEKSFPFVPGNGYGLFPFQTGAVWMAAQRGTGGGYTGVRTKGWATSAHNRKNINTRRNERGGTEQMPQHVQHMSRRKGGWKTGEYHLRLEVVLALPCRNRFLTRSRRSSIRVSSVDRSRALPLKRVSAPVLSTSEVRVVGCGPARRERRLCPGMARPTGLSGD